MTVRCKCLHSAHTLELHRIVQKIPRMQFSVGASINIRWTRFSTKSLFECVARYSEIQFTANAQRPRMDPWAGAPYRVSRKCAWVDTWKKVQFYSGKRKIFISLWSGNKSTLGWKVSDNKLIRQWRSSLHQSNSFGADKLRRVKLAWFMEGRLKRKAKLALGA